MTKAQAIYERAEALVADGSTKADAFRQIAEEAGRPVGSVRGAYYQHTRTLGGSTPRRRKREVIPAEAVDDAKALLARAIAAIDEEIDAARERAEEAAREHDHLKASAKGRKQALQEKIDALDA